MRNLLEPLLFDTSGLAEQFCQRNLCGCRSPLIYKAAPDRKYRVECPNCGSSSKSTVIRLGQSQRAAENEHVGRLELATPSGKSPDEILAELGF